MSTLNDREAVLRRALHAAADAIEPEFDGLDRIQARLGRPRPVAVAWVEAAWTDLRLRAPSGLQSAIEWLASAFRLAWERFGPTPGRTGSRASRTLGWLRPAAALGVTVAIVAGGAYFAIGAQQAIFSIGQNSVHSPGGTSGGGAGGTGGPGSTSVHSHSPFAIIPPSASPTCKGGKPASSASPSSPIGTISPTSSASPSTSPSGTGSPSPSASDTSSPNPSSSVTGATGSSTSAPMAGATASVSAQASQKPSARAAGSRSPAAKASPSPCTSKRPTRRNPGPVVSPNAAVQPSAKTSAAAVSFSRIELGKLNDGR
jgi:hypothetical protein